MARQLPPEGVWVTVSASLRSAHVDLLDEARGDLTRSEWLRKVALEALGVTRRSKPNRPGPERERLAVAEEALDAYARQNADVHRENLRLRDENAELRQQRGDTTSPVAAKSPKPSAGRKPAGQNSTEEKTRHRCPVKGWCSVCGEMKGVKR